jgi:excisionase family DNA binding protein
MVPVIETDWLTVAQARQIAQVGVKLIYREIKAGRLRAARIGNRRDIRIHRDWIAQWLERSATPLEIVASRKGAA